VNRLFPWVSPVFRVLLRLGTSFALPSANSLFSWHTYTMKLTKKAKKTVMIDKAAATNSVAVKVETPKPPRVVLELVHPDARQVFVAGSFNNWQPERTPLVAAGNGRWTGDLKVAPGQYEYLFVVDGQWLPDPNAKQTVANPFGGRNSILTVSK
jgi:1,4-alpha-glucan branching enzyme